MKTSIASGRTAVGQHCFADHEGWLMLSFSLGDGAELRALEPWHAEEFLANIERGREFIGQYIGFADAVTDLDSGRALLQRYAEKLASDTGRIYGIWLDGKLVGGVL